MKILIFQIYFRKGAAGQSCAEVLRQEAFNGRLILLTEEKHLPYDRTKCNKNLDMTVDKMLLRPQEFFDVLMYFIEYFNIVRELTWVSSIFRGEKYYF